MDTSWITQESPGLKPDWFDKIRSFLIKKIEQFIKY